MDISYGVNLCYIYTRPGLTTVIFDSHKFWTTRWSRHGERHAKLWVVLEASDARCYNVQRKLNKLITLCSLNRSFPSKLVGGAGR
jgi:hypothetical protein